MAISWASGLRTGPLGAAMFTWHPLAIVALVTPITWALALLVYAARPDRAPNRRLAVVFWFAGISGGGIYGWHAIMADQSGGVAVQALGIATVFVYYWAYLRFLRTLNTPLVAWMRNRPVARLITAFHASWLIGFLLWPEGFIVNHRPIPELGGWEFDTGVGMDAFMLTVALPANLLGIGAAWSAFHRESGAARTRARTYFLAFLIQDGVYGLWMFWWLAGQPGVEQPWDNIVASGVGPLATTISAAILAFGVLRHQLFGVELQVKSALRQSTVGAILAALVLVTGELIEESISADSATVGILTAVLIAVALKPVLWIGQRVSDRVLPSAVPPQEMDENQRLATYRHLWEVAMEDGSISRDERAMLREARRRLGLSEAEVSLVEAEPIARTEAVPA